MFSSLKIKNPSLYIVFLSLIGATPPLATDMYLAAIPKIAAEWNVHVSVVNLSLVLWFVSFSTSLLIFGPLSDKYGRRPILLFGLWLFVASSFLCGMATNPDMLIAFRIVQGMGAAAPSAMVMAICRDKYDGADRQKALAYIGVILAVAPMVAPSIGTMLLSLGSWRFIFFAQGTMVLITSVIALGYVETAKEFVAGNILSLFLRYRSLLFNREYAAGTTIMGLSIAPFYGFIAFSPIAYIKIYGLTPQLFSLLFGLNAVCAMAGSFASAKLSVRLNQALMMSVGFAGAFAGGLVVLFLGSYRYELFAAGMFIFAFFTGFNRPVSSSLVLEQVRTDIGSASSFMVFYQFMVGAFCMWLVTLAHPDPLKFYGYLIVGITSTVLIMWPLLFVWLRRKGRI
jgi:DHA1 family bicyclomycin/chloramphenicol resistance-like MFS transporter